MAINRAVIQADIDTARLAAATHGESLASSEVRMALAAGIAQALADSGVGAPYAAMNAAALAAFAAGSVHGDSTQLDGLASFIAAGIAAAAGTALTAAMLTQTILSDALPAAAQAPPDSWSGMIGATADAVRQAAMAFRDVGDVLGINLQIAANSLPIAA